MNASIACILYPESRRRLAEAREQARATVRHLAAVTNNHYVLEYCWIARASVCVEDGAVQRAVEEGPPQESRRP